jgi:hypothetical protein
LGRWSCTILAQKPIAKLRILYLQSLGGIF